MLSVVWCKCSWLLSSASSMSLNFFFFTYHALKDNQFFYEILFLDFHDLWTQKHRRLEHWKHFSWFTWRINKLYTDGCSVSGLGYVLIVLSPVCSIFKGKSFLLQAHLPISTVTLAKLYHPRYVAQIEVWSLSVHMSFL